jgi:tRNA dimethylallyltransferase
LAARDLDPNLPAMKAVGVREFAGHLSGAATLAQALEAAQRETRRYAKRQLTWMRGRMADWPRVTASDAESQWAEFMRQSPPAALPDESRGPS